VLTKSAKTSELQYYIQMHRFYKINYEVSRTAYKIGAVFNYLLYIYLIPVITSSSEAEVCVIGNEHKVEHH